MQHALLFLYFQTKVANISSLKQHGIYNFFLFWPFFSNRIKTMLEYIVTKTLFKVFFGFFYYMIKQNSIYNLFLVFKEIFTH